MCKFNKILATPPCTWLTFAQKYLLRKDKDFTAEFADLFGREFGKFQTPRCLRRFIIEAVFSPRKTLDFGTVVYFVVI